MKMESETTGPFRGPVKGISLAGLLVLLLVLGYYSGYRRSVDEAQEDPIGKSTLASRSASESTGAQENRESVETSNPTKSKPPGKSREKREPRSVDELPPAHRMRMREVEEFVDRLPKIEQELLEQHPLLEDALRIQGELRQRWNGEALSREEKEREAIFKEWAGRSTENKWKGDTRVKALKLDAYLEVLDDPKFAPFLEDGLQGGHLAGDMTNFFRYHLGDAAGLDLEGIESIAEGVSTVGQFREAFRRFAADVKAKPGNRFAFKPLPEGADEAAWQWALDAQRKLIVEYYEQSVLPEDLEKEYGRHYQTLQSVKYMHFLRPAPKEAGELLDRLQGGRIDFIKSIMPE